MGNTKSSDETNSNTSSQGSGITQSTPYNKRFSTFATSQGRKPLLTIVQRQIIKYCMDNSKDDIGERILRRTLDRRDDLKKFIASLTKAQKSENSAFFNKFLHGVCENLNNTDEINRISEEFGCNHVQFRANGFKPEFFSWIADSVTLECAFLDRAAHPAGATAEAWSIITSFVFSAVRDGYYTELRNQRKSMKIHQKSLEEISKIDDINNQKLTRKRSKSLDTLLDCKKFSKNVHVEKNSKIVRSRPVKKNDLTCRLKYSR